MKTLTREVLMKIIESLPENKIAYIVYNLLENSKIDKDTNLVSFFSNEGRKPELKENTEYTKRSQTISDYRFRNLLIRNFRKFPHEERSNFPYGIDFLLREEPASLILVGGNGTGKTSLFSAMEYTMTRFLSSASLRDIDVADYPHYLAYSNQHYENVQVALDTVKETIYSDSTNSELANYEFLRCFFCSERDLVEMGKQASLLDYITGQIGYEEYLEVKKVLEDLYAGYKKEFDSSKNTFKDFLGKKEELERVRREEKIMDILSKEKLRLYLMDYNARWLTQDPEGRAYMEDYIKALFQKIKASKLTYDLPEIEELTETMDASEKLNRKKKWVDAYEQVASVFVLDFKDCIRTLPPESYLRKWFGDEIKTIEALSVSNKDKYVDIYNDKLNHYQGYDFKQVEEIKIKLAEDLLEFFPTLPQRDIFEFLKENLSKQNEMETKVSKLSQEIVEKQQNIDKLVGIEFILPPLKAFIDALQNEFNTQIRFLELLYKNVVEKVLNHFSVHDEKYILTLNADKLEIIVEYKDIDGQTIHTTPREYLNSFRFKLFNMSVKVAMAMAAMRINKICHPIVFDDVFYSSDFENRNRVEEFIVYLFEAYKSSVKPYVGGRDLQVVFLTHDDIIMDAIREGIQSLDAAVPTRYGRLFDYREMNQPGDIKIHARRETGLSLHTATQNEVKKYVNLYIDQQ